MSGLYRCDCGYESDEATLGPDAPNSCPGCQRSFTTGSSIHLLPSEDEPTKAFDSPVEIEPAPDAHRMKLGSRTRAIPRPEIPGYEILDELGRGGMGIVYKARQRRLNRTVAIKMILAGAHATEAERDRFRKEAEAVAALQHPGIVQIFEIGEHEGQPFLTLEFVDGVSLSQKMAERDELMPAKQAAAVVQQLAEAVQYAHDQGVIHRDLKPANVLLGGSGDDRNSTPNPSLSNPRISNSTSSILAKVTDFGLAKRIDDNLAAQNGTKTGAVMGTPSYISPEQASGKSSRITPLTDVYSLGAILYEMLTGRPPFRADTAVETVLQVLNEDPIAPSKLRPKCPKDLETICLKCLSKAPDARYATATKLAEDLGRFIRGEPILARPLSSISRGLKWSRRHPAITVFGFTAIAAVITVLVVLSVAYAQVKRAGEAKEVEAEIARAQTAIAKAQTERANAQKEEADRERANANKLRAESEARAEELLKKDERNARDVYALQLSQVFTVCERDPKRALELLDDPLRCPVKLRDFAWKYLRRHCERQTFVYEGHAAAVVATAVSPDGLIIATADRNGQVRLWSPTTRVSYGSLAGHTGSVNAVAFSPDGLTIATAGDDGTVRLFDISPQFVGLIKEAHRLIPQVSGPLAPKLPGNIVFTTFRASVTLKAFANRARCVAFSQDGRTLAAGGSDKGGENANGVLQIWDMAGRAVSLPVGAASGSAVSATLYTEARGKDDKSLRLLKKLEKIHFQPVTCLAYSPDGQTIATGSDDASVAFTSVVGDAKSTYLSLHSLTVFALAYSPNGKTLATVDNGPDPHVRLWDLTERVPRVRKRLSGHTSAIYAVAFSPDSQTVATGGFDRSVRLWDSETGEERGRFLGHNQPVRSLAFLPDRRQLVSGGNDGKARVWRTGIEFSESTTLDADRPAAIGTAAISGNGRYLITGDPSGETRVWMQSARTTAGRTAGPVSATVWMPMAAFGQAVGSRRPVRAVAISDSGRYVAAAGDDGLLVWDLTETAPGAFGSAARVLLPKVLVSKKAVIALALSPDGKTLAAVDPEGVWLWNIQTGRKLRETPLMKGENIRELQFAPADGKPTSAGMLAVASGRSIALFDLDNHLTGQLEAAHGSAVHSLAFTLGGGALASGSDAGVVRVWDISRAGGKLNLKYRCEMTGHADAVTDLCFSRDSQTLITGGQDRMVMVWDPTTGQERMTLTSHTDRVVKLAMTPNDASLLSVGRDGTIKRWKAD